MIKKFKEFKKSMNEVCWISADNSNLTLTHKQNLLLLIYAYVGIYTVSYGFVCVTFKLVGWVIDKIYDFKKKKETKEEEDFEY